MHNMLMQYDGLDTIGDFDEDYGSEYDSGSDTDDDSEMAFDPHMEGMEDEVVVIEPIPIEQEVQVGYEEKKSRMWIHYKYACARGDVRWLKRASVCRPMIDRDPYGEQGPWRVVAVDGGVGDE